MPAKRILVALGAAVLIHLDLSSVAGKPSPLLGLEDTSIRGLVVELADTVIEDPYGEFSLLQAPPAYRDFVETLSETYRLPISVLVTLFDTESSWNPSEVSRNRNGTTDHGLGQLNSTLHNYFSTLFDVSIVGDYAETFDVMNPYANMQVSARYLRICIDSQKGSLYWGLVAYNGGIGNIRRGTVPPASLAYARKVLAGPSRTM